MRTDGPLPGIASAWEGSHLHGGEQIDSLIGRVGDEYSADKSGPRVAIRGRHAVQNRRDVRLEPGGDVRHERPALVGEVHQHESR